jgi:hypothetical protein
MLIYSPQTTGAITTNYGLYIQDQKPAGVSGGSALTIADQSNGGYAINCAGTGIVLIADTTASSSTATGALQVAGGVGVGGNIYVGGNIITTGYVMGVGGLYAAAASSASSVLSFYDTTNSKARWQMASQHASSYVWSLTAYDAAGTLVDSPLTIANAAAGALTISRPTVHTNITDINLTTLAQGSIQTSGGLSVAKSLTVGGNVIIVGTQAAASGLGGNLRYRDDTGTARWLAGLKGTAAATSYTITDLVASADRLTIDSAGATTLNSGNLRIALNGSTYASMGQTYSYASTVIGNNIYVNPADTVSQQVRYLNTHATYGHTYLSMAQGIFAFYGATASVTANAIVTPVSLMSLSAAGLTLASGIPVTLPDVYNTTTAVVANVAVDAAGRLTRATVSAGGSVTTTDDTTTNATMYPVWQVTGAGTNALKISTTKFAFNPSTGTLTTTALTASVITATSGFILKAAAGSALQLQDAGGVLKGEFYWDGGGCGILNNSGNWAVRAANGAANAGGSLYGTWDATNLTISGYNVLHTNNYQSFAVSTQYNTSLNTDSRNSRGPTRLYRSDVDSDYSIQTYWTGSYWILKGYQASDVYHGDCQVAYADSSGTSGSATSAGYLTGPAATNGSDGWFRSSGASGWYNSTQGVGIWCNGSSLIQTYGSASFQANGNLYATGTVSSAYSDSRLKENVRTIPSALATVLSFRGVLFNANDLAMTLGSETDKREQVGVIAQEIQVNAPYLVVPAPFDIEQSQDGTRYSKSGENYLTVQYDHIAPYLIEAIREQQTQIEAQAKTIQELKELINGRL